MTTTKTIGSGGDYSDVNAWVAYLQGLGTLTDDHVGAVLATGITTSTTQTISGITDGGYTITLTAASGASFVDAANGAPGNALFYNESVGAFIHKNSGSTNVLDVNQNSVVNITRLQLKKSSVYGYVSEISNVGTPTISNCIFYVTHTQTDVLYFRKGTLTNCLIHRDSASSSKSGISLSSGGGTVYNVLSINTGASNTGKGFSRDYGTWTVSNCVSVGFGTNFNGSCSTSHNNATDAGSFSGTGWGTGGIISITPANEFVNSTTDFRLASTSSKLRSAGYATGAPATDIFGQSRFSFIDIGPFEYQGAETAHGAGNNQAKPNANALLNRGKAKAYRVRHLYMFNERGGLERDLIGKAHFNSNTLRQRQIGVEGPEFYTNNDINTVASVDISTTDPRNLLFIARFKAERQVDSGGQGVVFAFCGSGVQTAVGIGVDNSDPPKAGLVYMNASTAAIWSRDSISVDKYYTVAASAANDSGQFLGNAWIDGKPVSTNQNTHTASSTINTMDEFSLGAFHRSSGYLRLFTGSILWIAVLEVQETPSDQFVAKLYQDNFPYNLFENPDSIYGYLGNVSGSSSAVGSASGIGAATGVGSSTAASVGSLSGVGTATGAGSSVINAVGATSGAGTAAGVGASGTQGIGAASGIGEANGVGSSLVNSVGACTGTGTAAGIAASNVAGVGNAGGVGTATGIGSSVINAIGNSVGVGTALGVALSNNASIGNAAGAGTALGVANSICSSIGNATGIGTATGISDGSTPSVGSASGTGTALGVGASNVNSIGAASGNSSVNGVSSILISGVGNSNGVGSVNGIGGSVYSSIGTANGNGNVLGYGKSIVNAVAAANGTGTVNAVSYIIAASVGAAYGTSSVIGYSVNPPQGLSGGMWKAANRGVRIVTKARSTTFTR